MDLYQAKSTNERQKLIEKTVQPFAKRAAIHDEEASFPFENINALKKIGYPSLTVPTAYGGLGLTLSEWLPLQELIARADGSTALSIGWHVGITSQLADKHTCLAHLLEKVYQDIVDAGALLNTAATEPETGSPTRGGKPTTTARKVDGGWVLTGRKTFTSMAPALDYIIVTATMTDDRIGQFLIHQSDKGVRIEETWNTISMRGTASHDLHLDEVVIPSEQLVDIISGKKSGTAAFSYMRCAEPLQGFKSRDKCFSCHSTRSAWSHCASLNTR